MTECRIYRLHQWLESLVADAGCADSCRLTCVIELSIPEGMTDRHQVVSHLEAEASAAWRTTSPDVGSSKGIYVWFWPMTYGRSAWPLYVGMAHGGSSCFRSRYSSHLGNARSGKDYLYDRVASLMSGDLVHSHAARKKMERAQHGERMVRQFNGMRVLTLKINHDEEDGFVEHAEALMLAAALRINEAVDVRNRKDVGWERVMNSFGRTKSMAPLSALFERAEQVLSVCLVRQPIAATR